MGRTDAFYRRPRNLCKPSIWSALYRSSFLRDNGIDFLETPGAYQDAGFNFKVWASAARATFIADPILHYRQDNEKSSVNSAAKVYCVCDEYASMTSFVNDRLDGDQRLMGILECMKFDSYMWSSDRLSGDLRGDFIVRASSEFADNLDKGLVDFRLFDPWTAARPAPARLGSWSVFANFTSGRPVGEPWAQ